MFASDTEWSSKICYTGSPRVRDLGNYESRQPYHTRQEISLEVLSTRLKLSASDLSLPLQENPTATSAAFGGTFLYTQLTVVHILSSSRSELIFSVQLLYIASFTPYISFASTPV